jgi:ADP-ribose pyrophosphatase YjhB (NUDIX family)
VNGTMVRQSGETMQDAIARQIREAFGMENATP